MRELEEKRREKEKVGGEGREEGREGNTRRKKWDERWIGTGFKIYRWKMFRIKNISEFTVYIVQSTLHRVHCTEYIVQSTLYRVHCTVYIVYCTQPRTMYTVQCTLYNVL